MRNKKELVKNLDKAINICFIVGIVFYISGIIFINFHSCQWYTFDAYSDAFVAKLMAENHSLFPDNWIFGNQYYVIATPVIAALVYSICHNSVLSMSIASIIMTFAVLACLAWCLKPFLNTKKIIITEFLTVGSVILGSSAATYYIGFSYFYTIASYYSCYVIGILLSLGNYLRLRENIKLNKAMLILSIPIAFALGMQSLRQTLVLHLPLIALSILMYILKRGERKSTIYSVALFAANAAGYIVMKFIPTNISPIIEEVGLANNPADFMDHLKSATKALLNITGLSLVKSSIKYLPLFIIAVVFCIFVVSAIIRIMISKDTSALSILVIFCVISLLAVYAVGVLLFKIRAIYLFIWYFLVSFSAVYILKKTDSEKFRTLISIFLIFAGALNFVTSFTPDIINYIQYDNDYKSITNELLEEDIDCLYFDVRSAPILAAYSKDKIVSGSVKLDFEKESGGLMYPVKCLQPIDIFKNASEYNSYFVLSNWSNDYLDRDASEEYKNELFSQLTFIKSYKIGDTEYFFYRFNHEILNVGALS